MRTFLGVWIWFAFSILGFTFFSKTDFFTGTQDFESNFEITSHPEEFLPYWSANDVRSTAARVFQAKGEGINLSNALGIQVISTFDAEIFIQTSSAHLLDPVITFQAKTKQNGSGNRPVYLYYSFSTGLDAPFSAPLQVGDEASFPNQNTEYKEFEVKLTQEFSNVESLWVKLEAKYGNGSGTAARLFIDEFSIQEAGSGNEPPSDDEEEEKALQLLGVKNFSSHALELTFSSENIPHDAGSYSLNNLYGNPIEVEVEGPKVRLKFEDYLFSNEYTLNIKQENLELIFKFKLLTPTPKGAILINEFMADPNPKSLTPPQPTFPIGSTDEYIELYNPTNREISLDGYTYNNRELEQTKIPAKSHVILVPMAKKELFEPYGKVVGINSFQALPNSSGNIVLKDKLGYLVDSLTYDLSWYKNTQKANGGWSLERINPELNCSDKENWTASTDPRGGSPGIINSVFDDRLDPDVFYILDHSFQGDTLIVFSLSQPIIEVGGVTIKVNGQHAALKDWAERSIAITTGRPLESGKTYEIIFEGLMDCNGRQLREKRIELLFDNSLPVLRRISPISPTTLNLIFDKNLGPVDKSNFSIRESQPLSATKLDSNRVQLILGQPLRIGESEKLYLNNVSDSRGNVKKTQQFDFLLDDQTDSVIVKSPYSLEIRFDQGIHPNSIKPQNFWVDRNTGPPIAAFADHEDEKLIHLVFDKSLPQNNLTWLQMENLQDKNREYIYTLARSFVRDMRAINVAQVLAPNDSTLLVTFNKPLLQNKAEIPNHYTVDNGIQNPIRAIQTSPTEIELVFRQKFSVGKEYRLSTIGLEDVFGVTMSRTVNTNFIYDLAPPKIISHRFISPFELAVEFNKGVRPYHPDQVSFGGISPIEIFKVNPSQYSLLFQNPPTKHSLLELWDISDLLDNSADYLSVDLGENILAIGNAEILDPRVVKLTFSDFLDPKTSIFPEQYLIQGLSPINVIFEENGYEVSLQLREEINLGDSVKVVISALKSKDETPFSDLQVELIYDDGVHFVEIQTAHSLALHHYAPINLIENNHFKMEESDITIQAFRNQTTPELTHLILSKPLEESQSYSLIIPRRKIDERNFLPASRRQIVFDRTPPRVVAAEAYLENEVMVTFDENLDPIMSTVANHYRLDNSSPEAVIQTENPNQVLLQFGFNLEDGKKYELFVFRVEDLNGNAIEGDYFTFTFEKPYTPAFKELVINEVMAAPKEGQTLPNAEYVELFNSGSHPVQLAGFRLANSRTSTVLPRYELQPESYIILCPQSQASNFKPFGPTLGLSNWPALLNGGDEVKIYNRSGLVLDSLEYQTSSYGGSEFASGGYSLEVVNPFQNCHSLANLRPSSSPNRGTPGKQNAVFDPTPDRTSPEVIHLVVPDSLTVSLTFSKPMQETLYEQIFSIEEKDIQEVKFANNSRTEVMITLATPLDRNVKYSLAIKNFRDCMGNGLASHHELQILLLPGEAVLGDVIINEVLFNPLTGSPKFVELHNTSQQYLNLKNWKLANFANGEISNRRLISAQDLILPPQEFLAITTDSKQLLQIYPKGGNLLELASLPSYPIREGTVILMDAEEEFIERFDYHEKMHNPLLKEVKGVSLERLQPIGEGNNPENWQSASGNIGWATPGFKNSQNLESSPTKDRFTISPEIFAPDALGLQPFTSIHYHMDEPGYLVSIQILGINGRLIREITQNQVLGQNGFYIWNGTDEQGVRQRPGYYIIWIQLTHPKGRVEQIRKTVAIGSKLR
ncbi:lamin tail domain-containing protein [Litoribacter ruber]|uniref:lamin tail domain-containing protein n=1 Tax=Litoribacter ruber TaxID=702568 RepID=UPI001BDA8228|nr:lamin tail domain-containing protein [Litoribacter ruber]MBT0812146.1 lamin tail domain-containing protein [Litoribacter ruber]